MKNNLISSYIVEYLKDVGVKRVSIMPNTQIQGIKIGVVLGNGKKEETDLAHAEGEDKLDVLNEWLDKVIEKNKPTK